MDPLEELLAIEEIRKLKARYFRALDAKDWDAFAGVFAPDAVQDLRGDPNMALIPDSNSTTTTGDGQNVGNEEIAGAWATPTRFTMG